MLKAFVLKAYFKQFFILIAQEMVTRCAVKLKILINVYYNVHVIQSYSTTINLKVNTFALFTCYIMVIS